MGFKQVRAFDKKQKGTRNLCLVYVRLAFSPSNDDLIKGKYDSAKKAWDASKRKHLDKNFPQGVAFPLYWEYITTIDGVKEDYGHIAIYLNGKVYSNPGKNTKGNPVIFDSIEDIEKTFGLGKYLGWSEDVNDVVVIEYVEDAKPEVNTDIKVGDTVLVASGAKDYNGSNVSSVFYSRRLPVDQLKGDRAVLDIGGLETAFHTSSLIKSDTPAVTPAPAPTPSYEDRKGQTLVIHPKLLVGNKDVDLLRRDGSKYPKGINSSDGRERRYKIVETVSDGFYKVVVPNADTSETYIKWRAGIAFYS